MEKFFFRFPSFIGGGLYFSLTNIEKGYVLKTFIPIETIRSDLSLEV